MTERLHEFVSKLKERNADWVADTPEAHGEVTVTVPRESIVDVCRFFADEHQFDMLADLAVRTMGRMKIRFEINYHLFSTKHYSHRLKVRVSEDDAHVPTVSTVWNTANWHERETYDLVGVVFDGHPDLRRILLPSDFDGHALRKDYPLRGYEPYSLN
ncbi:MAG: NADH-quinone oxidoreductase subunit C [Pyrinomonadaceae bacterium]|nr:NADH-quinone oxidoreductase subunit C [Pyrinomonadaceae bacterium]